MMQKINIPRPPLGRFNHVAVEVNDMPEAIHFYGDVLGLSRLPMPEGLQEKGIFWLDLGDSLAIHLVEKPDTIPGRKAHIAVSVEDVQIWRQYLDAHGIEYTFPSIHIYEAERIFLNDPTGNRIELVKWL